MYELLDILIGDIDMIGKLDDVITRLKQVMLSINNE